MAKLIDKELSAKRRTRLECVATESSLIKQKMSRFDWTFESLFRP